MLHNKIRIIKAAGAAVLALAMTTALSGCGNYWNGYSKAESMQLVEDALEEKYGEEFVVKDIDWESTSTFARKQGPLIATCYSQNDNSLYFEAKFDELYNGDYLLDTYVHEIVAKQIKSIMSSVLTKYYDKFAVEVDIFGLTEAYDAEITNISDANISCFSEALRKDGKSLLSMGWIVLDESQLDKYSQKEIEIMVTEIAEHLHLMSISIDFCYVPNNLLDESILVTTNETNNSDDIEKIVSLEHKKFGYYYKGSTNEIWQFTPDIG